MVAELVSMTAAQRGDVMVGNWVASLVLNLAGPKVAQKAEPLAAEMVVRLVVHWVEHLAAM